MSNDETAPESESCNHEHDQDCEHCMDHEHAFLKYMVAQCVVLMRENPDADDEELVKLLRPRIAGDDELAARLVEFVPLGYARAFFLRANWDLTFADRYRRPLADGSFTEYLPLKDEHLWVVSIGLAMEEIESGVAQDKLLKVLRRSCIAKQLETLAIEKKPFKGVYVEPCTFWRVSDVPCNAGYGIRPGPQESQE